MASKRRANRRATQIDAPLYTGGETGARSHHTPVAGHTPHVAHTPAGGHTPHVAHTPAGTHTPHVAHTPNTGRTPAASHTPHVAPRSTRYSRAAAKSTRRLPSSGFSSPTGKNNGEILLTRRRFLYGVLGVGAVAAIGGGAAAAMSHFKHDPADDLSVLKVPASAVTPLSSLTLIEDCNTRMKLIGNFELPYGSLVWANDSNVAACLVPTDSASPLTQVALLFLESGELSFVLQGAVGIDEGFEIYDVRATSSGLIWIEADILDGVWRTYTASLKDGLIDKPVLVEEGDGVYETPSLAVVDDRAFWQVLPKPDGPKKTEDSLLKTAPMGFSDADVLYRSHGRMATPIYALGDSVVITPRTDTNSIHYQLTRLDAKSGIILDTMVLPTLMKPLEAGYGNTGFTFSFDAIYNYGDGIANLGTYAPATLVSDGKYSEAPWFCFGRTPTAAPAWCGPYFMVKSTRAVCGVDIRNGEYFVFDVESGADDYGEYLASSGTRNTVVTFANINHKPLSGRMIRCCRVRVWTPVV